MIFDEKYWFWNLYGVLFIIPQVLLRPTDSFFQEFWCPNDVDARWWIDGCQDYLRDVVDIALQTSYSWLLIVDNFAVFLQVDVVAEVTWILKGGCQIQLLVEFEKVHDVLLSYRSWCLWLSCSQRRQRLLHFLHSQRQRPTETIRVRGVRLGHHCRFSK